MPTPVFPTYTQWLADHPDEVLVDLLWRLRAFHATGGPGISRWPRNRSRTTVDAVSGIADVAALRQLDAESLAVLHALVHAGATRRPVAADDVATSLGDLCDLAGTSASRRPSPGSFPRSIRALAHRALAYGPGLHLDGDTGPGTPDDAAVFPVAVPEHLQALFAGTTDLPWVLVDGYRCPLPTADIPGVLAELPKRQRRMLDTLADAGGIGHSATLDDPDRPLAAMIATGVLDRVDAGTGRLSPRVRAVMADRIVPDPGGDFTFPLPVGLTGGDADRADGSGVARVVETLRRVGDLLVEIGPSPVRQLSDGGVGVRELSRLARALAETTTTVSENLLLARHADLIASADGVWGITDRGRDYLDADTARRWALLLTGWSGSPHAPWEAETTGAHLLQASLDLSGAAALRQITPELVTVVADSGYGSDPAVQLWRLRPAVAAHTSTPALTSVLHEAEMLGLRAGGVHTRAATALAEILAEDASGSATDSRDAALDTLTRRLADILPAPVRMLIIQADLTVLAPGLLAPETEAVLRLIADVESTGMASVWRISPESLARAAASGATAEQIRHFLAGLAPEIPQGLDYLITDAFRTSDVLTADTAAMVLTAPDEAVLTAALAALSPEEAIEAGLRRLAPTVAVSRSRLSRVVDLLEEAGVRVEVDGAAPPTDTGPAMTVVAEPWRPEVLFDDVREQLEASVEAFRRSRQTPEDTGHGDATVGDVDTETVREPRAIMTALRTAYDSGTRVEISYVNADGAAVQEWISVVTMSPVSIVGVTESDGLSLRIQPHRIAWVATPVG